MHHFLYTWIKSTAFILAAACLIPGFSIFAPVQALGEAVVFGSLAASLRPFFEWIDMPVNAYTLAFSGFMVNGALMLWTSMVIPGFWIHDLSDAIILIAALTYADTMSSLGLALAPSGLSVTISTAVNRSKAMSELIPVYVSDHANRYAEMTLAFSRAISFRMKRLMVPRRVVES